MLICLPDFAFFVEDVLNITEIDSEYMNINFRDGKKHHVICTEEYFDIVDALVKVGAAIDLTEVETEEEEK